ncbi:TetR/AcrR family transcriptional regulator [Liquorilactobacillus satsumensis]|uniref:HTH tetR-type domain-containing protein n=3 Tax=Liquorilactobacillus satsumensis TaxID=259059 RepID=A0A0R1V7V0_9LACO|nr:TetR/AcrR family transcriptional regulator [Liquorilactobacillus satsumensis]KRL99432.1 hypothetical protein FD50_GL000128 [Liquorilactobacillus satsumensis DSM 16230 = JCM 12392]MCC7665908.1 TetR/AcrR family transcriptional regulator [Liquorilactobacillus satsumensis]MCP9312132.1 TetR/AcrR family transcriptional regulator [Liquorilactobacillus satsumensis]MCP9327781.1 TetR/AcrR family transcriptional regulator [Liquorilactobacillus satsumensis]MCP9356614.1 TetR/AcrR family transcriptional 
MGQLERKFRERKLKQQDVIDAAERIFAQKDYATAGIDEIAKEAEFSKKTLYVYFNSKEQIYFEIALRGYRKFQAILEKKMATAGPTGSLEKLRLFFNSIVTLRNDFPVYLEAIIYYEGSTLEKLQLGEVVLQKYYQLNAEILELLKAILVQGRAEGRFSAEMANEQGAAFVWSCIVGISTLDRTKENYLRAAQHFTAGDFMLKSFEKMLLLFN